MRSGTAVVIMTVGAHIQGVMETEANRTCEGVVEATRDVSCTALAPWLEWSSDIHEELSFWDETGATTVCMQRSRAIYFRWQVFQIL